MRRLIYLFCMWRYRVWGAEAALHARAWALASLRCDHERVAEFSLYRSETARAAERWLKRAERWI